MIPKEDYLKSICKDPIDQIENYEEAVNSDEHWSIHHRLELSDDGKLIKTADQLRKEGKYYDRPASELIFVKAFDHRSMHSKSLKGRKCGNMTHAERVKARRHGLKAAEEAIEEVKNMRFDENGDSFPIVDPNLDPNTEILEQILANLKSIKNILAKINYREGLKCGEEV